MYSKYKDILDHIHSGVLYCKNDEHSTILYANDYFYQMIGYTREEIENDYNNRFADFVVDDVSAILVTIDEKIANNEDLDYEYRMRKKDGSIFWVHDTAKYDRENNCWYVTIMDITDMKSLDYERERLEFYLNSIPNKIVISDSEENIIYENREAQECSYYNSDATSLKELIGHNIIGRNYDEILDLASKDQEVVYETRYRQNSCFVGHDTNHLIPVNTKDKQGKNYMMVSENVLKNSDILTGFPTRLMFENYYEYYKKFNKNHSAYICIVDIDNFKVINDTYGHNIGDAAIQLTANRLLALLEREDYICRYGGDEFVILFFNQSKEKLIEKLNQLIQMTTEQVCINDNKFTMTYSIGIASTKGCCNYEEAFDKADQTLYEVKSKGKSHVLEYVSDVFS